MITISSTEFSRHEDHSWSQTFQIQPLEIGQGITIGNSLRRVLINDITGYGITAVRINGISSEFDTVPFLRDDTVEILGNLKQIIFQETFHIRQNSVQKLEGFFHVEGPCIVTAGMLKLPKNSMRLLNPEQYICTIVTSEEFFCEVDIELGKGYRIVDEIQDLQAYQPFYPSKPTSLLIDTAFTPIKRLYFTIKVINDIDGNLKECLYLSIVTRGNKSPGRCMYEGFKYLIDLFYPFLDFGNLLLKSSTFAQEVLKEQTKKEPTLKEKRDESIKRTIEKLKQKQKKKNTSNKKNEKNEKIEETEKIEKIQEKKKKKS